jgi:hypothetical protein
VQCQIDITHAEETPIAFDHISDTIYWYTSERPHGLKYSLFYGRNGLRIVGYDNERGKGDHKHLADKEYRYRFVTVEKLMADFLADLERAKNEHNE